MKAQVKRWSVLLSVFLVGGLLQAQELTRGTQDARLVLPGTLAFKVPDEGPNPPYTVLLVEFRGTATEAYLKDARGELWRIERPRDDDMSDRRVAGRLRQYFAVSIPPGSYNWVGFSRWNNRHRINRLYLVLDADPVALEVQAGSSNFGGILETRIEDLPRTRAWKREHGWEYVAREDFRPQFRVTLPTEVEQARIRNIWRWTRSGQLPYRLAVVRRSLEESFQEVQPSRSGIPGTSWGVRPIR